MDSLRSILLDRIDRIPSIDIRYSIFCGSLFIVGPAIEAADLIEMRLNYAGK